MQFLSDVVTILLQFHKCQNIREALEILSELGYNRLNCEAVSLFLPAVYGMYERVRLASATMKRSANLQKIYRCIKDFSPTDEMNLVGADRRITMESKAV